MRGRRGAEDVDLDLALSFGIAEDVAAGDDEGLAAGQCVDDRAAAAGPALGIFDAGRTLAASISASLAGIRGAGAA